jgi:hypothetical protein
MRAGIARVERGAGDEWRSRDRGRGSAVNSRLQWWLVRSAAVAWLAAWFLPVIDGYLGWAAFSAALEAPFRHTFPAAPEDAIPQVFSALTNIAFPIMLIMVIRERVIHHARFLRMAILCLVINLYWLAQAVRANEWHNLLAGYYAWLVAFALLVAISAISVVSNRQTSKTPTAGTPS